MSQRSAVAGGSARDARRGSLAANRKAGSPALVPSVAVLPPELGLLFSRRRPVASAALSGRAAVAGVRRFVLGWPVAFSEMKGRFAADPDAMEHWRTAGAGARLVLGCM